MGRRTPADMWSLRDGSCFMPADTGGHGGLPRNGYLGLRRTHSADTQIWSLIAGGHRRTPGGHRLRAELQFFLSGGRATKAVF